MDTLCSASVWGRIARGSAREGIGELRLLLEAGLGVKLSVLGFGAWVLGCSVLFFWGAAVASRGLMASLVCV